MLGDASYTFMITKHSEELIEGDAGLAVFRHQNPSGFDISYTYDVSSPGQWLGAEAGNGSANFAFADGSAGNWQRTRFLEDSNFDESDWTFPDPLGEGWFSGDRMYMIPGQF